LIHQLLASESQYLRGWTIHLELEDAQASPATLAMLTDLAEKDPAPWVRLALASTLQRLPVADRWSIASALSKHGEDASDAYLPLMLWYGMEPLAPADNAKAMDLALAARIPVISKHLARRAAEDPQGLAGAIAALRRTENPGVQSQMIDGIHDALVGHRHVAMPESWAATFAELSASKDPNVHRGLMGLAVTFNDGGAIAMLHKLVADPAAGNEQRAWAIERLLEARDTELAPLLEPLVGTPGLSGLAIRGLAAFDHPKTPGVLLSAYPRLSAEDQRDAVTSLCARPKWAVELFKAIDRGDVPRTAVSSEEVRQLAGFADPAVTAAVERVWGAVRETAADKKALVDSYRSRLSPDRIKASDSSRGRAIFARVCANCHTLFDAGGTVGPNLTGSQRANLDYVLTNVLDPNAVVPKQYQMVVIQTTDGRVLNGIVKEEDDLTLALQTTNEIVKLSKDEIEVRKATALSMMPEGMLVPLSDDDIRDLMCYLASPEQVPLPAGAGGAK
ncbi:MAG TPA: hypothetical protein VMF30_11670, partial [Pirellulales bacterium]|nr:hypothetical protein [Pirellulales bacterium]